MKRFINYIRETKGEMTHVSWPTRRQTVSYTIIVIILSLATAAYLGLLDFLFTEGLSQII